MKYIVAGGRDFRDSNRLNLVLEMFVRHFRLETIISGAAKGADSLAVKFAETFDYCVALEKFPADWKMHGTNAGPIRNQQMAQAGDGLIAFWDGRSRGTKDMIEKATRSNLEVHIYRY